MALSGILLEEDKYIARSKELGQTALEYFSNENKLLFGEGKPWTKKSPKGCLPIDLGYNVEESLVNLFLYSKLMNEPKIMEVLKASLTSHLEFMLPDGAWDNSWGTRNYKWTYWGSRTTDGCQAAYGILGIEDPIFSEASFRNLQLLKKCTHEGILYGGPHFKIHGLSPSIHHTFCHAKALATALIYGAKPPLKYEQLPRETARGIRYFSEIDTYLVSNENWKATVTGYDWTYMDNSHASGGAISLLWHKKIGPILTASLTEYQLIERDNMQPMHEAFSMPLTPRIETIINGIIYHSINDLETNIQSKKEKDCFTVIAKGKLVNNKYQSPESGEILVSLVYQFFANEVKLKIKIISGLGSNEASYILPVICSANEKDSIDDKGNISIQKEGGVLNISANVPANILNEGKRVFNHVPGFEALPVKYKLEKSKNNELVTTFKVT